MIKFAFAFEQICFMKFAFNECEYLLASSHPYLEPLEIIQRMHSFSATVELLVLDNKNLTSYKTGQTAQV